MENYSDYKERIEVEEGENIVNDVWGIKREKEIEKIEREKGEGIVIMNKRRERIKNKEVIEDKFMLMKR